MPRSLANALDDILDAIARAEAYANGKSARDLISEPMLNDALERCIERVAEAASQHVPDAVKANYPNVPWQQIRSMGNRLRHRYFAIDPNIIWDTITVDFPELRKVILEIQQKHVGP